MHTEDKFWRDAAMPYLEARRALHSRACYKPHMHATVSVGAVDQGGSILIDAGHTARQIGPGTVVWIPQHQRHSCNPLPFTAWSYQMLYLDPQWLHQTRPGQAMAQAGTGIHISHDARLYAQLCALTGLLFSPATAQRKQEALLAWMEAARAAPWECMPAGGAGQHISHALQAVLHKIQEAPSEAIDWDGEACAAGLSRTQLIRSFKRITGMTPHAWQQNARINAAREQLRGGQELASVAYAQGFADQAHFQRVFKSLAGSTPGNYRA